MKLLKQIHLSARDISRIYDREKIFPGKVLGYIIWFFILILVYSSRRIRRCFIDGWMSVQNQSVEGNEKSENTENKM